VSLVYPRGFAGAVYVLPGDSMSEAVAEVRGERSE
jgi:hypothetical protein